MNRQSKQRAKTTLLVLADDDPELELSFEIRHRLRLSTAQRFRRMFTASRRIAKQLKAHGHQKTALIIKRS